VLNFQNSKQYFIFYINKLKKSFKFNIITPNMNKRLIVIFFVLVGNVVLAQKDTTLHYIPIIKNQIVYQDSIITPHRKRADLDAAAKKWFYTYFKTYKPNLTQKAVDPQSSVSAIGIIEFEMAPEQEKHTFYLITNVDVSCRDNGYNYKISYIYIKPKDGSGFSGSSEALVSLYHQKHYHMMDATDERRKMIVNYLANIDANVRACISSLKKAMRN
jgi:hypothetical protein